MSYINARREDEKERRRGEILDATEALYAKKGWEALTVDQVARSARLSRGLVYVYFRDKDDLLFAIGERAMRVLSERFKAAAATPSRGMDQVDAIGRAYMGYAYEFPHYFDFCSRFQSHSMAPDPSSNEGGCRAMGEEVIRTLVQAIELGIRDASIRADVGNPLMLAMSLWAFTHGIIQLAKAKSGDLASRGIAVPDFSEYAFSLVHFMAEGKPAL